VIDAEPCPTCGNKHFAASLGRDQYGEHLCIDSFHDGQKSEISAPDIPEPLPGNKGPFAFLTAFLRPYGSLTSSEYGRIRAAVVVECGDRMAEAVQKERDSTQARLNRMFQVGRNEGEIAGIFRFVDWIRDERCNKGIANIAGRYAADFLKVAPGRQENNE